jgi:plastocyanin
MINAQTNTESGRIYKKAMYVLVTFLIVIFTLFLLSCESSTDSGINGGNDENGTSPPPESNEVTMGAASFNPGNLTVETGTTVTWVNTSNEVHTVTSGSDGNHDGLFDSGNMNPEAEFTYTFNEEGTFPYYCIPHLNMGMTGTITVSDNGNGGNQVNNSGNGSSNDDSGY